MQEVFTGTPSLTVEVNNPDVGTAEVVSVPTNCDDMMATVRAIPNTGHVFGYWKKNGVVVSFQPEYSFAQNRKRLIDIVNKLMVTKGERGGGGIN